jgi:biopolymer transport protein ExbB
MIELVGYGETFVFAMLLIASILALAVGLERAIIFKRNSSSKTARFAEELIARLRRRDLPAAGELVRTAEPSPYSRFARFSLDHAGSGISGLQDLMAGRIIEEKITLEKRLTVLNTLGNNAPFIGLLGTVLGVIKAFHGLGTLGSTGAEVVMRSISRALLATAAGLFIAIPVVIANNYFSKKVKIIIQQLEILSREFSATLHSRITAVNKERKTHGTSARRR